MSKSRLNAIVVLVVLIFSAVVAKLVNVQIFRHNELEYAAKRQQIAKENIKADRGMIFDRNGVLLAFNRTGASFYIDRNMAKPSDIDSIIRVFSSLLEKPESFYRDMLRSNRRQVCIEKKLADDKVLILKKIKINGLYFLEDPTRLYQYDHLASHLLGYTDVSGNGTDGIERALNSELAGIDGKRVIMRDNHGRLVTVIDESSQPARPGNSVFLTIDKNIQSALEEVLHYAQGEHGAAYISGIVMDPNNGEILAFANVDDYDPNFYSSYSDSVRRNKALTDTYEPGSTFKALTLAAMLDRGLVQENETIFAENGAYTFNRVTIRDAHPLGAITVKDVFAKSSNIGMAKLSHRISQDDLYLYLRGFGLGNPTNIELPGEAKGKLKSPENWTPYTKVSLSYGYEVSVTPLQLLTAYAAIINGGELVEPRLVGKIASADDGTEREFGRRAVRRVISSETSNRMRQLFKAVVEQGTGSKARINGVEIGGKTGTSRKLVNGQYSLEAYNSSFIGFFPLNTPKYLVLIHVNSPSRKGYYGGDVAAPVFTALAKRIIEFDPGLRSVVPADIYNGRTIAAADSILDSLRLDGMLQIPVRTVDGAAAVSKRQMPDLTGVTLREAVKLLNALRVEYSVNGSGRVLAQSIVPGTPLQPGMRCTLEGINVTRLGTVLY